VGVFIQARDQDGVVRRYPDGQPLLYQPVKLVRAFEIIGAEIDAWSKAR
jgi:hypothetical protein